MTDVFDYRAGAGPLLISIPHDGRAIPPAMEEHMTDQARELPDTDWHVRRLYEFSKSLGASVIAANYSRYVVDLNRSRTDDTLYAGRSSTGLFPKRTFAGEDIYLAGETISADEQEERIETYWQPYHDRLSSSLNEIKRRFGYALLWDAHSIPSRVPLLFDGELPELNFGSNDAKSCASRLIAAVTAVAASDSGYSTVLDGRFRGGYITRTYGDPENDVHAVQLELAQRCYMSEESSEYDDASASQLQSTLRKLLQAFLESAHTRDGV